MYPTIKFKSKSIGRCSTVYEREDLDSILPRYSVFIYRDQNGGLPTTLEARIYGKETSLFTTPPLGYGCYGQETDGTYTLLTSYIDSSD